jgi:hypothetical protein
MGASIAWASSVIIPKSTEVSDGTVPDTSGSTTEITAQLDATSIGSPAIDRSIRKEVLEHSGITKPIVTTTASGRIRSNNLKWQ